MRRIIVSFKIVILIYCFKRLVYPISTWLVSVIWFNKVFILFLLRPKDTKDGLSSGLHTLFMKIWLPSNKIVICSPQLPEKKPGFVVAIKVFAE
jgi:hypothetical protein